MKGKKENALHRMFNDLSIRIKLIILYATCIISPLFLVNGLFLQSLVQGERKEQYKTMEHISERIEMSMNQLITEAETESSKICTNKEICAFLEKTYGTGLAYYTDRQKLFYNTFLAECFSSPNSRMTIFADNPTILNGGVIWQLNKSAIWYQQWKNTGENRALCIYFLETGGDISVKKKMFSFVRKMRSSSGDNREKVVRVDIPYTYLSGLFHNICDGQPAYICSGGRVIYSNQMPSSFYTNYERLDETLTFAYQREFELFGTKLQTCFLESDESFVLTTLRKNMGILLLLLFISLVIPLILLYFINRSFTGRLRRLSRAFHGADKNGELMEVEDVRGRDEIGYLMASYNHLVRENNHLIKTVYEHRLHKQEMEIGKQNAELLALRMQVNPHFLFNMLESIRMSSLLNHESRAAEMIEKLAVLERQAVDWDSDLETIGNEINFVNNYLSLQKFRFGDRFSYQLDVDDDCLDFRIPKMTILTFVENACVHGTDKKLTETRVFVTIRKKTEQMLEIEIEDTSGGMTEEKVNRLQEQMENCTMDMLRESKHTGMINACLRLKMMSGNKVKFELESEEGVGTYLVILLPIVKS